MKTAIGAGVIPPLVTPLDEDESVRYDHLEAVIEHTIAGGVNALFVMGSTGEFPRFPVEVRHKVIAETVKIVAGRVPVLAGVGETGLALVKRNVAQAEKAGADAVVVTLPYYFPVRNDDESFPFFDTVARATRLPVMLYNIPGTCNANISHEVIERLFQLDNIIGIKDSSGDPKRLDELLRRFKNKGKDFAVVIGSEELSYEGLRKGADGMVPSMANPFPRLFADIYAAALAKDDARLKELCDVVDAFNRENSFRDSWLTALVWRKKALAHMGICNEYCAKPYIPVTPEADKKVAETVARYKKMYA